ncbi:hypothetical protein [Geomesophilobacter sediminis]|uniref:Uncharacterized protein n=1 Tax=Geomesophilobacter sediminis TaxID=2798584 RepID=A0A8J7M2N4_9BACT|nr:hypothetical protein [Geomesophilobacter sediminis]MBJ6727291.1 hypothetical protein [Geomesophilobacter sediminis]
MKKNVLAAVLGSAILTITAQAYAENWVKHEWDVPNKNVQATFYDADSIKGKDRTISWTEKFQLTPFGVEAYNKHLTTFPTCKANIEKKGQVSYHQIDFEMKDGKFRPVGKRNYTKDNQLLCTDKDMGSEFNKNWVNVGKRSPMNERYYLFVTKYKLGNY